jgi:integrase/recombinase XerD
MQLCDRQSKRLYLTAEERCAFLAATADRPVRTLCVSLHDTGCRISEALTPERIDLSDRAVMFESLKKRRRGIYRVGPVPPIPSTPSI